MIITLDGPVASGKSTLARELARHYEGLHFNSGLLYRTVAYVAHHECGFLYESIHTIAAERVQGIIHNSVYTAESTIIYKNRDITAHLKHASIDRIASRVSELEFVRALVNEYARSVVYSTCLVADGRDCGTVMFPEADYSFFITADATIRAQRWVADQRRYGKTHTLAEALALVEERDKRDSERLVAPLKKSDRAIVIDTSHLTFEETMKALISSMQ